MLVCPDKRRPEENKDKAPLAYTPQVRSREARTLFRSVLSALIEPSSLPQPSAPPTHPLTYPSLPHFQVDTWAVGILAYEMLVGYPPFEQESRAQTYEHIMYKDPRFPSSMSNEARAFIALALNKVSAGGYTFSRGGGALNKVCVNIDVPWGRGTHIPLAHTLPQNANSRPTVFELLKHTWIQQHCASGSPSPSATPPLVRRQDSVHRQASRLKESSTMDQGGAPRPDSFSEDLGAGGGGARRALTTPSVSRGVSRGGGDSHGAYSSATAEGQSPYEPLSDFNPRSSRSGLTGMGGGTDTGCGSALSSPSSPSISSLNASSRFKQSTSGLGLGGAAAPPPSLRSSATSPAAAAAAASLSSSSVVRQPSFLRRAAPAPVIVDGGDAYSHSRSYSDAETSSAAAALTLTMANLSTAGVVPRSSPSGSPHGEHSGSLPNLSRAQSPAACPRALLGCIPSGPLLSPAARASPGGFSPIRALDRSSSNLSPGAERSSANLSMHHLSPLAGVLSDDALMVRAPGGVSCPS